MYKCGIRLRTSAVQTPCEKEYFDLKGYLHKIESLEGKQHAYKVEL